MADAGHVLEQIPQTSHFSVSSLTSAGSPSADNASKGQTEGQIMHLPQ
jgi:hypothetical protein